MRCNQESFELHPRHGRRKNHQNQQLLWRSCTSGDVVGYGSTCPLKEEQIGSSKLSWQGPWWLSRTGPTYGRSTLIYVLPHCRRRLVGSFKEASKAANVYRGELLGLMAIHLILVSVNRVHKSLSGNAKVVSNCLGALQWVTYLPPYRIPSRCKHSNILQKNW
jgi:hypothetical protein